MLCAIALAAVSSKAALVPGQGVGIDFDDGGATAGSGAETNFNLFATDANTTIAEGVVIDTQGAVLSGVSIIGADWNRNGGMMGEGNIGYGVAGNDYTGSPFSDLSFNDGCWELPENHGDQTGPATITFAGLDDNLIYDLQAIGGRLTGSVGMTVEADGRSVYGTHADTRNGTGPIAPISLTGLRTDGAGNLTVTFRDVTYFGVNALYLAAARDPLSDGLILDLDAETGISEAGGPGTGITEWLNQATSGGDDVVDDGGAATVVAGPNGRDAVRLGEGIRLSGDDASAFDALMQGDGHTWFAVMRDEGNGGSENALWATLLDQSPWTGAAAHIGGGLLHYDLRGQDADQWVDSTVNLGTGWHIMAGRLDAGVGQVDASVFTDGPTADATVPVNIDASTDSGTLTLGAEYTGGSEYFDGDLARLLIYDRPLTGMELNEVGALLAALYAIPDHGFSSEPVPVITDFTASSIAVTAGSPVTLSWTVIDPEGGTPQLAILPTPGDVTGLTSVQVNPLTSTTYTLAAQNIHGSSDAEVTVSVEEPPTIDYFFGDPEDLLLGEASTLHWNVSGAEVVHIDGGIGEVFASGTTPVSPTADTSYTLTATNVFGTASAQVLIQVDASPVIHSFVANPASIDAGTVVTLAWDVDHETSLSIDQGVGDVTGLGSVQVSPASTRSYTLTAINAEGLTTASVEVFVGETLIISEFLAVNNSGLEDEDGDRSDWIEIHNTTGDPIDLNGWYLTDDDDAATKWAFPEVTLAGGEYLVVFASDKDRAVAGSELHTNFKLSRGGEYLALVKPDGLTIACRYAPEYPGQTSDFSYGIFGAERSLGYFDPPTPGEANGTGYEGFVEDTSFTVDRGFYEATIYVGILTDTPGAQIRYTVDGSEPSDTVGALYTSPIEIDSTTVLRAVATRPGFRPSNIDTHTYLYPADVKTQPEMDQDVLGVAPYSGSIENDLKALPALSLVLPHESMFDPSIGIYANSGQRGPAWERALSVEFFSADGSEEFQVDAGIRIHGANARGHVKKPFKLYFRSDYGPGRLDYPLFPGPVKEFDKLVLRAGGHEAWSDPYGSGVDAQAWSSTYLRDQFLRQIHEEMGHLSPRGRPAHLYINGAYWGLYIVHERPDDEYGQTHLGGVEEDFDVIKTEGAVVNGNKADWSAMQSLANAGLGSDAAYAQMLDYIDLDNFIDNMIVRIWSGDIDWLRSSNMIGETGNRNKNWYALRRTRSGDDTWKFFVWDGELAMGKGHTSNRNTDFDLTDVDIADSPGRLYTKLRQNPEFTLRFADRLRRHFFNDGSMTPAANQARWSAHAAQIQAAVVAESARWGDAIRSTPYTRDVEWQNEVDWIHDVFMTGRTQTVLNQFQTIGLYPSVDPVDFLVDGQPQHGGHLGTSSIAFTTPPSGTIYYTTDGSDPRAPQAGSSGVLIEEFASNVTALVPSAVNGGSVLSLGDWTGVAAPPNSAGWSAGSTGVGYERTGSNYAPLINLDVSEMDGVNPTVYVRVPFSVADQATIDDMDSVSLQVKYDDGFVAYLNGTRVAARNEPAGLDWQSGATDNHADSEAVVFESFDLTAFKDELQPGANLLAIHALNDGAGSSDLLIVPRLTYAITSSPDAISPTAIEYAGAFPLGGSSLVRARVLSPGGEWSAGTEAFFEGDVETASVSNLVISEIHYHPPAPTAAEFAAGHTRAGDFEFIELFHRGSAILSLAGVSVTGGVDVAFPAEPFDLAPGERVVLVSDTAAFTMRYGTAPTIAGEYLERLDDGGEDVCLLDSLGAGIMTVEYGDGDPWPISADGAGASLVLADPTGTPAARLGKHYRWRSSAEPGGTPGAASENLPGVVINAVLTHTDLPATDTIELYNTTDIPIDLGGWYLSDAADALFKYRIPPGTLLDAGQYITFDEGDFNPAPLTPGTNDFALSGSRGDEVWLVIPAGGETGVHRFVDQVAFGGSFNGEYFGRVPDGPGRLAPIKAAALGQPNGLARVGPVVITEVNHHPGSPSAAALLADPSVTGDDLQFIEIYNPGAVTEDLTDWRIRGDGDYDLAPGTMLAPGQCLLVLSFNLGDASKAARLAAFRAHYGIGPEVTLIGGFSGTLHHGSGRVELQRPDDPPVEEPWYVPHVTEDEVLYDDVAPWPEAAAGASLQRTTTYVYGNYPYSWRAAAPTPGAFTPVPVAVPEITRLTVDSGSQTAEIKWVAESNVLYQVQGATTLAAGGGTAWQNLGPGVAGPTNTLTDTVIHGAVRLYRIVLP